MNVAQPEELGRIDMERTWKPTTAGMLCIVAGSIGAFCVPLLTVISGMAAWPKESSPAFIIGLGILGIVFDTTAIAGGVYTFRGWRWRLALADELLASVWLAVISL